ncbi:MAG: type II toxin-antitoxin system ParD family antitoxin [Gammaproteobacteria bacterium]|nr:type II toxin-antitoxin system ParD family antitoxin [Gammaproteobacteria bacterium]
MSTVNTSLPDSLKEFVDNQVGSLGYGNSSEYMRELIRKDRDRQRLRGLLFDGANSPQSVTTDLGCFDKLRSRVRDAADR